MKQTAVEKKIGRGDFSSLCQNAAFISQEILKKLMKDNQDTEYGKRWNFSKIVSYEDYRTQVPVTDYEDYEAYIKGMLDGETGLLTAYPVKHFIMTSGSTGKQKRIPLTEEALKRCVDPIYYDCFSSVPGIEQGDVLHLSVFRMEPPSPQRDTILSAAYFRELYDRGHYGLQSRYLGGTELLFSQGIGCAPYVKLWIALSSPQLKGLQAFFLYDVLMFLRYFEGHWQEVLENLKNRRIPKELPLTEPVRAAMLALPAITTEWAEHVEEECSRGFFEIVKRIWPSAAWVSGVGGSSFGAQEGALREYLGDIPIHYFSYAASECMMAVALDMERAEYALMPESGFFEFIPYQKGQENQEEKERYPKTLASWQVEEGKRYELLVTNFSGLYRYRLNDVVEVTGFYGQTPVLRVCFRKNQAVNIAGEKMDLQTMSAAAEEFGKRMGIRLFEYSVCPDIETSPGRYLFFYEGERTEREEQGGKQKSSAAILDQCLKVLNEDYMDLRRLGLLGEPMVMEVLRGSHEECKKKFQQENRQNKPLQLLTGAELLAYMNGRICVRK